MKARGRGGWRSGRPWMLAGVLLCAAAALRGEDAPPAATASPPGPAAKPEEARLHGAGSGRFEIISAPGAEGVALAEWAELAWASWREPLGLPSRLPNSITVRLVPEPQWPFGPDAARINAEPGGVVSVWIRAGGEPGVARERRRLTALAEGVLRRKAFLAGADPARAKTPAWLAAAAAEAALMAARPAMLDAWQASMRAEKPASLRQILLWAGDGVEGGERRSALGVWLWLREAGGPSKAWERFADALIAGESPGGALAREYARLTPRAAEAREWELAWRVAAARLARARATPVMEPAETRRRLERIARIVTLDTQSGAERGLPAWGEWATRREAWPAAERAERSRMLVADFTRLHPFYRNAAGSLGRAWTALAEGREDAWRSAAAEWAQDMETGRVLEEASRRLLDEAGGG